MPGVRLAARLALADAAAEARLALATLSGIAAVLAPLIVLFGLKAGVIDSLREALVQNPRAREIVNQTNRTFDAAFFARLAARPDVAFIVPRTRSLAASGAFARSADSLSAFRGELLATAAGDPLLAGRPPPVGRAAALSATLAERLGVGEGATIRLRVDRIVEGRRETLALDLAVAAVLPREVFARDAAFVPLPLLLLIEDFQEGTIALPVAEIDAPPDPARLYAGFRLHARRLEDVVVLDRVLRAEGIEVVSQAEEVAGLLALDRSLGLLFVALAALGGAGYSVSLGVTMQASVERKRRALALLRLMGMPARGLLAFPLTQAVALASAAAVFAGAIALGVAAVINRLGVAVGEGPIARITPEHLAIAAVLTVLGAVLASLFAAARAAAIEPAEGLRDA
ncbi:FtsX-like permease family protein [Elioraea thermophila]|uniref:FtsX-like permease family protein n=1 Tax=Elioraea thermophila TaxID=2185104 RepID=UPI000DF2A838|nr:FtsX-like permease family protein [Elioraea thermophila]